MNSDWGWGSMWFGFPLLGKNRATIWAVTCEHHPDKKSHADTSLAIGHMPGCLPQHSRCSLMHFPRVLQGTAYWALQWLSHFCRGNFLLYSQCHQKTLSPENDPAMAERVVQQLVQLPPLQQVLRTLVGQFCSQYLGIHLCFPAHKAIEKIKTWNSMQIHSGQDLALRNQKTGI